MIQANEIRIYIENQESSRKRTLRDLQDIEKGIIKTMRENSISFKSLDQLRQFLTPKRIELLKVINRKKPNSIYELAKLVKRTPENVNTDIKMLKQLGFVSVKKVKDKRRKSIPSVNFDKMIVEIDI
ncbi:MAG: hypothetical protein QF632_03920 [Candidatus Woesearchaeota archaeon]|jgi:predicted transcriptional regulator|nr:hypothetical protein [Candidatus Woesearchaeota archaeon]MDP7458462.1 hypothetical protein [Candidatus Woesearchaeota archaeon]